MRRTKHDEQAFSSGGAGGSGFYPPANRITADGIAVGAPLPPTVYPDMVIRRMAFLRGPNIWTYRPVIEAIVDIGYLEEYPSNTQPGFYERLTSWLPG